MTAGSGFAQFGGDPVLTNEIPQWAFPGAHPASLRARAARERVLAYPIPADELGRRNYEELLAFLDEQIAMIG